MVPRLSPIEWMASVLSNGGQSAQPDYLSQSTDQALAHFKSKLDSLLKLKNWWRDFCQSLKLPCTFCGLVYWFASFFNCCNWISCLEISLHCISTNKTTKRQRRSSKRDGYFMLLPALALSLLVLEKVWTWTLVGTGVGLSMSDWG